MTDLGHVHCSTCINVKKCHNYIQFVRNRKKPTVNRNPIPVSSANDTERCEIISCPEKCEFLFHVCKLQEHLLMCPRSKVECINAGNGCDMVLERRFRGSHLEYCPASVVVCTIDWSRRGARADEIPFKRDPSHLDLAALNSDLETLNDFRENVPVGLRRLLQSPTHESALMPLAVSGHRIPDSIASQVETRSVGEVAEVPVDLCDSRRSTYSPPAGLQGSLVHQLQLPSVHSPNALIEGKDKLKEPEEELSLLIDVITKHSGRRLTWSTFMCAQELRRDEFANHFRNVHTEIRTQLDGWLFRRCPLASYGCSYGSHKFYPAMEGHRVNSYEIKFNNRLNSFCPTQRTTDICPDTHHPNGTGNLAEGGHPPGLSSLPNELLLRLTEYLDPASLKCLTFTSVRMRDICAEVVCKRGIVVLDWEKNAQGTGWIIRGKRWMFSNGFSAIRSWIMSDTPSIGTHLLTCPFYLNNKNIQKEPFSYPVRAEDL